MKRIKHVVLVNPYVCDFKLYDEWMKPLGLYYLAAKLRPYKLRVSYLNALERSQKQQEHKFGTGRFTQQTMNKPGLYADITRTYKCYGMTDSDFLARLDALEKPDVFLLTSGMSYWYLGLEKTIALIRSRFPHCVIGLGGIYARLCPQHAKQKLDIDKLFAHFQLDDVLRFLEWPQLDPAMQNQHRPLPFDYSVEPHHQFLPLLLENYCPYDCTYCAAQYLNQPRIQMNHAKVIACITSFYEQGVRDVCFYDDGLLLESKRKIEPLLDAIYKRFDSRLRFHCPNGLHARFLDEQLAQNMRKCGFETIRLGAETADAKLQRQTGAKTNNEQVVRAIDNLFAAGFSAKQIGVYVMLGLQASAWEQFERDVEYFMDLGVKIMPVCYSPVPKTQDFELFSERFPIVKHEPLSHNDTYFVFELLAHSRARFHALKQRVNEHNRSLAK